MNVKPENIELVSQILTFFKITHTNTTDKITTEGKISPLTKTTLDYASAKHLWNNFATIISFLEKQHQMTIPYFDEKSIYIIDTQFFIPTDLFYPIENEDITINSLFDKKTPHLSPEMKSINSLPANISSKSFYYSLADYLANSISKKPSNSPSRDKIISIYGTKLYWMLYWNLDPDPPARVLLVI
tara:strand:- start:342 stop:899 length:558 start_codon:yes stop_codon:yes gene_type:complete